MDGQIRKLKVHKLILLFAVMLGITTAVLADPVWEPAPQKKDILPNTKGLISCFEKADHYEILLEFPGRDLSKILVNLKDGVLHVEAPSDGSLPQVSRSVPVEGASRDGNLSIERSVSRGLLLVTIPKQGANLHARPVTRRMIAPSVITAIAEPSAIVVDEEIASMISQMRRMEKAMASMVGGFPDTLPALNERYTSEVPVSGLGTPSLQDEGDHYLVRVALLDKDPSKVNVSFKDGILIIQVSLEEAAEHHNNCYISSSYQYSQAVNIPGPVRVGKMKVDRRGDELVVTLPKLKS